MSLEIAVTKMSPVGGLTGAARLTSMVNIMVVKAVLSTTKLMMALMTVIIYLNSI